ncbi:hypothetical protein C4D60_Mb05t14120 [Musa balbisiana]|uniref:Uncharacterized protein n=1 Tax=Musa balbisiana TaxID=52838 RepID=A0A4S8JW16_MUSBA|nr:hypothetical protein C4D60_Mb05t14120 [Musa balbisiana]
MENRNRFYVSSPNPPIYLALPTNLRPATARPTAAYLRDSNGVHYLCLQAETECYILINGAKVHTIKRIGRKATQ